MVEVSAGEIATDMWFDIRDASFMGIMSLCAYITEGHLIDTVLFDVAKSQLPPSLRLITFRLYNNIILY